MAEIPIKVSVAGRTYPLTVERAEEENVRRAAKMVNEKMKTLELDYAVNDKQDLLAMTALQFANQYIDADAARALEQVSVKEQLQEVEKYVSDYLKADKVQ